jgi:hypothetical protein
MAVMAVEAVPEAAESGAAGGSGAVGGRPGYTPRHAATQPRGTVARPMTRPSARPAKRGQPKVAPRKTAAQKGRQPKVAPQRANRGNPAPSGQKQSKTFQQRAQGQLQGQAKKQGLALTRGAYHRIVIAEFLATVLIIAATPFLVPRDQGSSDPEAEAAAAVRSLALSRPLVRLTAACVVFFILALAANGERTGRVAAALGALVVLGALLNSTDTLTALGQMFTGAQAETAGADATVAARVDQDAAAGGKPVTI